MVTKITRQDLINVLKESNAEKITVLARKELKMNKTKNPFYKKVGRCWVPQQFVEKQTKVTYLYGGSYEDRVNEALAADGSTNTFTTKELPWGEWLVDNRIIEYKGEFYVRCYLDRNGDNPEISYFVDGKDATESQLESIDKFEVKSDVVGSHRQLYEGLSEEKTIVPQNIKFSNIVTIDVDGTEYELAD